MIQIKRFMDKVSLMESRQSKDVVIPISEARGLRDEIAKLLSDLYEFSDKSNKEKSSEVIDIQVKGGSFK